METNAYFRLLNDMEKYIKNRIYTGKVRYYPQFIGFFKYQEVTNSIGVKLYVKQIGFIESK